MLKLLIFDWDGTLADSVEKIIKCKRFLANKYNLPLPNDEVIKSVQGTKFEHAVATCFPTVSKETLSKLSEEFHTLMQQTEYQADLFLGTKEMLEGLKKEGIRLAIATAKVRKEFDTAMAHNHLYNMFEVVCCGNEHEGKPNPAMLNHIIKKCDVCPEECLMVGDTVTDMLFAANAGIKSIGVTFGAHPVQKLQAAKPTALISEWAQLSTIVHDL